MSPRKQPAEIYGTEIYGTEKQFAFMKGCYERHTKEQREGYLSALFDIAHMADAVAREIAAEHTVRGRVTKEGVALEAALKRFGDALWQAKERLAGREPSTAPALSATGGDRG